MFSIWFYTLFLLYSAVAIPLLTLGVVVARPFIGPRRALRLFRRFIGAYGWVVVSVLPFPFIRVRYTDRSGGDETGPCVFVCNHRSSSDPFLLSLLGVEGVQVVNIWPFKIPVLGRYARWAGYLSIREMTLAEFTARMRNYLAEGVSVAAFPEGTRSASRRMGPFHGALFRVCLELQATVVPICLTGNEDKPRRGSLKLHPGCIRIHRLPAIPYAAYRHLTPFAFKNHVREIIANHIIEMEGHPDETDQKPKSGLPIA